MTREHWWNTDFDLALQPGWSPTLDPNLAGQVRQLEMHALLAAEPEDTILVTDPLPEDFLAYLRNRGITPPQISRLPGVRPGACFSPYGWSPQAVALRGRYDNPVSYPRLEVVRRVNGRRFGHDIETGALGSEAPAGSFTTLEELEALLAAKPDWRHGWVIKTEHGNAALGNRRLRSRRANDDDQRWAAIRLERGPMVLERWLPRKLDLSVVFEIAENGSTSPFRVHETIHTSDGGVIGALFSEDRKDLDQWHRRLEDAARKVAQSLHDAGYFGPVCQDALVWTDGDSCHLRPLVEINARRHAGEGWSRVALIWGGCVYGRFYTTRRLRLPPSYEAFERALGSDAWDPRTRTGALLTSPLWLEATGGRKPPLKLGVVFRTSTRSDVLEMDARFRARFER